jgi:hypothetical protein
MKHEIYRKKWRNFDMGTVSTILRFYKIFSFPEVGNNYLTVTL